MIKFGCELHASKNFATSLI